MTRGEMVVILYESARDIGLSHQDSMEVTKNALDNMYTELEVIWHTVYFFCRKNFSKGRSVKKTDLYLAKVRELLDGQG